MNYFYINNIVFFLNLRKVRETSLTFQRKRKSTRQQMPGNLPWRNLYTAIMMAGKQKKL